MNVKYYFCTDPYSGNKVKLTIPVYQIEDRSSKHMVVNDVVVLDTPATNTMKDSMPYYYPFVLLTDVQEVSKADYDAYTVTGESPEFAEEYRSFYEKVAAHIQKKEAKMAELAAKNEAKALKLAAVKKAKEDKKPK